MFWAAVAAACLGAPDVIMISVDTLRADHLSCYGYAHPTSPNLDRFAKQGVLFEDCVTEVPLTSPSFGAMMTSRFPRMNGAARNGLPLPESVPTVAEQFQAAGYQTMCVQSNWTLKRELSGLARGFEHYDDDFHKKRWGIIKSERYGDEVSRIALELLANRDPNRPLFMWIHYSDPHAPYRFHDRLNPTGKALRKLDEVAQTRARYDSEVAYTDEQIQRVLDAIPLDKTFVLFVGDHGESLHEHDYLGHGRRIYHDNLLVPLIIRGPGIEPGRTRAPVRGIDVGPTLLAMAGLGKVDGMLGLDLIHETVDETRVRVVETYGGAVPKVPGAKALMASRPPMRQGVILENWKLILDGSATELFDLVKDPGELTDLSKDAPERVAKLTQLIETWDAATSKGDSDAAELTDEDVEALESLGYVE